MNPTLSVPRSIPKPRAALPRLAVGAIFIVLTGCATVPGGDDRPLLTGVPANALAEIESTAAAGDAVNAAEAYLKLAKESNAPARQALELRAAEAFYLGGQSQRALRTLGAIDSGRLTAGLRHQEQLIAARAALQSALPERTLTELNRLGAFGLPPESRIERLGMMAAAYRQSGDPVQAAAKLDEIDRMLGGSQQRLDNQVSLLLTLSVLDAAQLRELSQKGSGRLRAWAGLAELLSTANQADATVLGKYRGWRSRHGSLPVTEELPRAYYAALHGDYAPGTDVWVLLPRSGHFSGASMAIDRGLRHADEAQASGNRPRVKTANSTDDAEAAYERAVSNGADLVIGPLQKTAVNVLSSRQQLPVPTLALNRDNKGRSLPGTLYQFTLAPEDEAISAANYAWDSGLRSALLLYPQGPWGNRLAKAFREHWRSLGGNLAGETVYGATPASMGTGAETLLAPGKGDLIFLIATDDNAQSLWAKLKLANQRNLPVLATSHVYNGSGTDSLALTGLYFVDIPWLIGSSGPARAMPRLPPGAGGSNATLTRLAAMGIDSYRLAPRAHAMSLHPGHFLPGVSGGLSVDGSGRVLRTLALARFEAAGPVPVTHIEAARPPASKSADSTMSKSLIAQR
ncbi:Penicillin-binding protein activator LpoA precursor [Thiorhodovibrio winogradskyi]|uniref:Penicillin-binding protein activator LpoA n=1 Tax=Thiorhodovibrio winogradskyi TaxID=77007 RepID=A0ABZ0S3E0_9GAMM|nr:penicillin-binding protein activator [Thiorhodovibrio winogradskyi]